MQPEELFNRYLDSARRVSPSHVNRASQAGHPCERALVYMRVAWQQAAPPERRVQGILLFGQDFEQDLRGRLAQAGYVLRQPGRPMYWPEVEVAGTDDGDISWDDGQTWHMIEIKGLHTYYFDRVTEWRSFLTMGPIYAKYPAQIQLYMLLNSVEAAYFVIGRKGSYDVKFLPVELDYDYAEGVLKKLERVNAHVKAGTLPDKINDVDACEICEFKLYCNPELPYGEGSWIFHQDEAIALLDEHERLAAAKSEAVAAYERTHQQVKRMVGDIPIALIGTYRVQQKADRKGVTRMRIQNLGKPEEAEAQSGECQPAA